MWQNSLGHCVLKAEFPKGKKELAVSLFQVGLTVYSCTLLSHGLLLFSSFNFWMTYTSGQFLIVEVFLCCVPECRVDVV